MWLIDGDRLEADLRKEGIIGDIILNNPKTSAEMAFDIMGILQRQPTVFPMFGGRTSGKKLCNEYVSMCKVLDDYGIDSTNPVESLQFVLAQYQKIICELTHGRLSKLTYYANDVISEVESIYTDEALKLIGDEPNGI